MLLPDRRWPVRTPAPGPDPWGSAFCSCHPGLWSSATSRSLTRCSPALPSPSLQSSARHLAHPGALVKVPTPLQTLRPRGAGSLLPQTLSQQPCHQLVLSFAQMWHPEIRLQIKVLQNPGAGFSSPSRYGQCAAKSLKSCWAGVGGGISHRVLPCRRETEPRCAPRERHREAAAKSERLCPGKKSLGEAAGTGAVSRVALGISHGQSLFAEVVLGADGFSTEGTSRPGERYWPHAVLQGSRAPLEPCYSSIA